MIRLLHHELSMPSSQKIEQETQNICNVVDCWRYCIHPSVCINVRFRRTRVNNVITCSKLHPKPKLQLYYYFLGVEPSYMTTTNFVHEAYVQASIHQLWRHSTFLESIYIYIMGKSIRSKIKRMHRAEFRRTIGTVRNTLFLLRYEHSKCEN